MNPNTQFVAGLVWTIDAPGTEQKMPLEWAGREWTVHAIKAESKKGTFWIYDYRRWEWREGNRPFDRDWWLALDGQGKVVVRAPDRERVLWSLATGKSWEQLPDCWATSSMVIDQPQPERHQPAQPAQLRQAQRQEPRVARQAPTKRSVIQRVGRALGLVVDDGE